MNEPIMTWIPISHEYLQGAFIFPELEDDKNFESLINTIPLEYGSDE